MTRMFPKLHKAPKFHKFKWHKSSLGLILIKRLLLDGAENNLLSEEGSINKLICTQDLALSKF